MASESSTRTTRLSGELDERYEEYRDSRDMTDAEALRVLIRTGLEAEEDDGPTPEEIRDELREEIRELSERQETRFEKAGYLTAAVVAGTSPLAGMFLTSVFSLWVAMLLGLLTALLGLLIGTATKITADTLTPRVTGFSDADTADAAEEVST
jgi:hypothetical protein